MGVFKEMQERLFKEKEDLEEKIKAEQSKISMKKKAISQFDAFIKDIRQEINTAKQQNRKLQDSLANYREQAEQQALEREELENQLSNLPEEVAHEIRLQMLEPRATLEFNEELQNIRLQD